MILVATSHTMARAIPVEDDGLNVRHPYRRARLIENHRRWENARLACQRAAQASAEAFHRAEERFAIEAPQRACLTGREQIQIIADQHGVSIADILGPRKMRNLIAARFDAIVAVYENCRDTKGNRLSYPAIGRLFERDHTSIMSALKRRGHK